MIWIILIVFIFLILILVGASSQSKGKDSPILQSNNYWGLLDQIQDCKKRHEYRDMLISCEKSLLLLNKLVSETKKEYRRFDIQSIPAIEIGCQYWSALGEHGKLLQVKHVVDSIPEIKAGWGEKVDQALENENLSKKLKYFIAHNPGFLQNKLGKALNVSGRITSQLVHVLENMDIIIRVKKDKSYELYLSKDNDKEV